MNNLYLKRKKLFPFIVINREKLTSHNAKKTKEINILSVSMTVMMQQTIVHVWLLYTLQRKNKKKIEP